MKNTFTLLLSVLLFLCSFSSLAQINTRDSIALVELYRYTKGEGWKDNTNWLKTPVAEWKGIIVDNNRVKHVHLDHNNLSGILPSSMGLLTEVLSLHFCENDLSGTIGPWIAKLTLLQELCIKGNNLSGKLPMSLCSLPALSKVTLQDNDFDLESCYTFLCLKDKLHGQDFYYTPQKSHPYAFEMKCNKSLPKNASAKLEIMPNPAREYLFIRGLHDQVDIQIFDLTGKEILHEIHEQGNSRILPLSTFQKGIYFLKVHGSTQDLTKKFNVL